MNKAEIKTTAYGYEVIGHQIMQRKAAEKGGFCHVCGCGKDDRQFIIDGVCFMCREENDGR